MEASLLALVKSECLNCNNNNNNNKYVLTWHIHKLNAL